MFISHQLKQKNIAEYLIYMWQVEDLIRANGCDIERIKRCVVDNYPSLSDEQRDELSQWYEDLIEMMRREEVMQQGHLQINKNIIVWLTDLHLQLMASSKFPYYNAAYYKALPFIVELRAKGGQDKSELENCFDALYGVWMLRLQRKEVSSDTATAVTDIVKFIGLLSDYYKKDRAGELDLED